MHTPIMENNNADDKAVLFQVELREDLEQSDIEMSFWFFGVILAAMQALYHLIMIQ